MRTGEREALIKTFPWTANRMRHLLMTTWCHSVPRLLDQLVNSVFLACFFFYIFTEGHQHDLAVPQLLYFVFCRWFWWITGTWNNFNLSLAGFSFWHSFVLTPTWKVTVRTGAIKEENCAIILAEAYPPDLDTVWSTVWKCPYLIWMVSFDTSANLTLKDLSFYCLGGYS